MRLLLAIFLLTVFAFQALPVAAFGKSWVKQKISVNDNTGDDGDDDIPGTEGKIKKAEFGIDDAYIDSGSYKMLHFIAITAKAILPQPEDVPVLYAGEIDMPPPDCC